MLSEEAAEASSFLGTAASEFMSSSSRLGWFGSSVSIRVQCLRDRIEVGVGPSGTYGDSEVVTSGELGDLTGVSEGGTHDDGLVAVLLVVVEDGLDRLDTGVLLLGVLLLGVGLEPVQDTANERRDQEGTGLSGSDGLGQAEHERQVGVNTVVALQDLGGLDALPCRGDLDQDTVLGDTRRLVELMGPIVSKVALLVFTLGEGPFQVLRR